MKIGIDIQGCQSEGSKTRGIGRYSLTLIRHLIENSQEDDEFILVSNKSLGSLDDVFLSFIRAFGSKVQYFEWTYPGSTATFSNFHEEKTAIAEQIRSYFFCLLNCDIILITSFFEGFRDNSVIEFDKDFDLPPIASIFYDLIPLIIPEIYLDSNSEFKSFYLKRLEFLNKVDCLLSISKSSSQEAYQYLSLDKSNVHNIYAGCDREIFYPADVKESPKTTKNNLDKYILYSGAGDPRKNLNKLIEAYSLLNDELIWTYKLVLVGKLLPEEILLLKSWITSLNLNLNQVVLLGYVSDKELADLYRNCSLFVFPSIHEGFGLPVLEAMSCGAVVLGSNTTSIPEVVQDEYALFDPHNALQISELIAKALTDKSFYNQLLAGLNQRSLKFTWKKTAFKASAALLKTIKRFHNDSLKPTTIDSIENYKNKYYNLMIGKISKIISNNKNLLNDEIYMQNLASSISLSELNSKYIKQYPIDNIDFLSWRVEGPFDSNYSLAILNREFALALSKENPKVSIVSTEGPGDYDPNIDFIKKNTSLYNLYSDSNKDTLKNSIVVSRNLYPPRVNDLDSRINMLHAYGWEETEIPSKWIEDFNLYLDGMTVMSSQVKKNLIDCGFYKPILICGLGVDHINTSSESNNLNLGAKSFRFLHISSCFPRKGIQVLLEAYGEAFTINDDVSLIIKTFPNPHNKIHKLLAKYKKINNNYPHIIIIEDEISPSSLKSLYQYSHVYVSPSHGEGFGLPIAEAMSLSIPVITTSWGGQLDFVSEENSWLIDFQYEYAKTHFKQFNSVWAMPSCKHLAETMKYLKNSDSLEIKKKSELAYHGITTNYSWSKTAEINTLFAKRLLKYKAKSNIKLGIISTWNTKCGIADYAYNLTENIGHKLFIYAPCSENLLKDDEPNVFRCWELTKPFSNELKKNILEHKISTIIIQFNFGFFDFLSFRNFIKFLSENNIITILQMHSTNDNILHENKKLLHLVDSLILIDRILVHTCSDLNTLKSMDIINNVSIFPHGILDYDNKKRILLNKNPLVNIFKNKKFNFKFATSGYCLPNKGFLELIKTISILVKKNRRIHFTFFTPIYNADYDFYPKEMLSLINKYKLEKYIKIDSHYYENKELLDNLSQMDAIIYPYQTSYESSSASVRQGIASGSRVIVTPISIFEDVRDIVDVLPGTSPEDMALGISTWIFNQGKKNTESQTYKAKLLSSWRENHKFSKLSSRLTGLISALEVNKQIEDE